MLNLIVFSHVIACAAPKQWVMGTDWKQPVWSSCVRASHQCLLSYPALTVELMAPNRQPLLLFPLSPPFVSSPLLHPTVALEEQGARLLTPRRGSLMERISI